MLRKVYLYGDLEKKYGHEFEFDADSFVDCVRALNCAFPDFNMTISPNEYALVVGDKNIGKDKITLNFGSDDFHIIPRIFGSGMHSKIRNVGIAEFVIGALLVVGGVMLAETPFAAASPWMIKGGIALMVGGAVTFLMSYLFPDIETEASRKSFIFSNVANSTKQGEAVPLCYGQHMVGSVVVSGSLDVEDISDDYSVKHSIG